MVKETSKPALRIQQPKVDLEQIYNRFTQSRKEVTVNDLQKEIKETKSEVRTLKQELTILRVDYDLLNRRIQLLENTSHQSNEEGPSDEEVDQTVNPTTDLIQEPSKNEIFKLLELDRSDSESFSSASDSELRQIYRSSSESSSISTSSGPDEPTPCKDGCCRNKTISV